MTPTASDQDHGMDIPTIMNLHNPNKPLCKNEPTSSRPRHNLHINHCRVRNCTIMRHLQYNMNFIKPFQHQHEANTIILQKIQSISHLQQYKPYNENQTKFEQHNKITIQHHQVNFQTDLISFTST